MKAHSLDGKPYSIKILWNRRRRRRKTYDGEPSFVQVHYSNCDDRVSFLFVFSPSHSVNPIYLHGTQYYERMKSLDTSFLLANM